MWRDLFMFDQYFEKFDLAPEITAALKKCKCIAYAETKAELEEMAYGPTHTSRYDVVYPIEGNGTVKEAEVVRCKNGCVVNFMEDYMRRRDPNSMAIGDDLPSDKPRFKDRFGYEFSSLRQETLDWLSTQQVIMLPFSAGPRGHGYPSLMICPLNAAFFALSLANMQGFTSIVDVPEHYKPRAIIFVAPPFRHTHFDGKQVVVHNRSKEMHEVWAYNLLAAIFRGLGDSKSPLLFVLVACIVNIFGDLLLVAGLHLDAAGAALATVFAQAISVVCAIVILIKKKLPFSITKEDFCFNHQCKKFLGIGLPLALQEFLTQISFLALCAFVNRLGLEASSGYGVACKIVNFAMLIPSSLMQSMASFVSQNIGAGKQKRAKKSMFTGIGVGLVFGCLVFILVMFKGNVLAGLFSTDTAVIQKGYDYLKGFAPETILTAIMFSMVGYFNGNNQTLWVMFQGLFQTLLVRLPMSYYMSIQPDASLTKIGLAAPASTLVGILLNVIFFLYFNKKINNRQ